MDSWDPTIETSQKKLTLSPICLQRIKKDLVAIFSEPPPGIFVVPDENDMSLIHALITGPEGTPYEGGFFYLLMRYPADYPVRPPRVKLMTTEEGKVRFNPNMYADGRVCLSILGTWLGPSWSPAHSLGTVLISIQSLLCENPYHNEPGHQKELNQGDSARYSEFIRHETLRVAVCDMMEGKTADSRNLPKCLRFAMEKFFLRFYEKYELAVKANLKLSKKEVRDPLYMCQTIFNFNSILERLQEIKKGLDEKLS